MSTVRRAQAGALLVGAPGDLLTCQGGTVWRVGASGRLLTLRQGQNGAVLTGSNGAVLVCAGGSSWQVGGTGPAFTLRASPLSAPFSGAASNTLVSAGGAVWSVGSSGDPMPSFLSDLLIWFDADHTSFARGPNFRYPGWNGATGGDGLPTAQVGTVLTGAWAASSYNNQPRRDPLKYNVGAVTKNACWNDANASRALVYGGAQTDMRQFHEGAVPFTIYAVVTRRATTNTHRIFNTTTTAVGRGLFFTARNALNGAALQIGNGSAGCVNAVTSTAQLTLDVPHIVSATVYPYAGIGSNACQMQIDDNAPTAIFTWLAAPATGLDSSTTAKIAETFNGHTHEIRIDRTGPAPGSARDLAIRADLKAKWITGLTPDVFVDPRLTAGEIVFVGDSRVAGGVGPQPPYPWPQMIDLSKPFEFLNRGTPSQEVGPAATAGTMLDPTQLAIVDAAFRPAGAFNICELAGGTNDLAGGRSAVDIYADITTFVSGRHAVGFSVTVATVLDNILLSSTERDQMDALNALIRANSAGADRIVDEVATMRAVHSPWDSDPTYWQTDRIHESNLGNDQAIAPVHETALQSLLPP